MYLFHTVHCYPWGLLTVKYQINSSCPNVLRPKISATLYNLPHVYLSYVKILFNDFCCVNIGMATHFEIDYSNHTLIAVGFLDVGLI